jgi:ribulose 1,5-bisphosphate synthetase/thiazole synthase
MLALLALATCAFAHTIHESSQFKPTDIITKDVAIVGGGASGTYAAIRLKDKGKTVALIEQKDHLVRTGGSFSSTDPKHVYSLCLGRSR